MPLVDVPTLRREDVEAVVALASRAPSLHNTQPWRWQLQGSVLTLRADRPRQLEVADPDGHSLLVSCGAADQLTRLALAARGWHGDMSTSPDDADPDLLASFNLTSQGQPDQDAAQHVVAAGRRRSERGVFGSRAVSEGEIDRLRTAAEAPGVYAHFPSRADETLDLAVAVSRADRSERDNPAYAKELAEWIRSEPGQSDGVPTSAIPAVSGDRPRHTDIPLRDFELGVPGTQLIDAGVDERPLIGVIFTVGDSRSERLCAGRSMMRLMIQAELGGLATCALSQAVDLVSFRAQLRTLMSWTGYPQMMVRIGQKPESVVAPRTARRAVGDVLTFVGDDRSGR